MKAEENTLKLMGFSLLDLAMWKALVTMIIVFSMMWWALCMENKTKQLVTRWLSSVGKESACNAGDPSRIPGLGKSPEEGKVYPLQYSWASPCGSAGKESACKVGDLGSNPGLGRSPGERKGNTLQYSGLENSMDCIVRGVAKSQTQLSLIPTKRQDGPCFFVSKPVV